MKDLKEKLSKQKSALMASLAPSKAMLCLSEKDLPEIKKWKVGKTYTLTLQVKQVGLHEGSDGLRGDFEVQSAKHYEDQSDD